MSRSRLLPSALSRSAELGSVGALFSLLLLGIRIVFRMCVCGYEVLSCDLSRYSWLLQAGRGGEIIIRGFDFTCQVSSLSILLFSSLLGVAFGDVCVFFSPRSRATFSVCSNYPRLPNGPLTLPVLS